MSKLKVGVLALVAIFAVTAVSAVAAQAAPNWTVKGAALGSGSSEGIKEAATVTKFGSESTAAIKIVAPELWTIRCSTLGVEKGSITGPNLDSTNALVFGGCSLEGSNGEQTVCTVTTGGGTAGTVKTVPLSSELKRNASAETFDYLTPTSGTTLFVLEIGNCAVAGKWKYGGTIAVKPEYNTNAVSLGFSGSKAIAESSEAPIKLGARTGYLQGSFDLELSSGNTWGVNP